MYHWTVKTTYGKDVYYDNFSTFTEAYANFLNTEKYDVIKLLMGYTDSFGNSYYCFQQPCGWESYLRDSDGHGKPMAPVSQSMITEYNDFMKSDEQIKIFLNPERYV
jgi:hypothetical protein